MNFKNLIKNFIPPILLPSRIKNFKNYLLREKNKFEYENNFYKRHSFIMRAICSKNIREVDYLEIGVALEDVFNCIPLPVKNKIGLDPVRGGTHRMTSDDFFKNNTKKFDVVFIDGLHHYEQCHKDCLNSLKALKKNGIILFHDFLPRNSYEEHVPRKQGTWSGDVWKVAVELMNAKNIDFKIANIDRGVGLVRPKENYKFEKIPELEHMRFKDFYDKYYKSLPIISSEEALEFLD